MKMNRETYVKKRVVIYFEVPPPFPRLLAPDEVIIFEY